MQVSIPNLEKFLRKVVVKIRLEKINTQEADHGVGTFGQQQYYEVGYEF